MKNKFDYVIVTHLPAFYKTNLYNELAKKLSIFVVFIASKSSQRTNDFINLNCNFEYIILNEGNLEERRILTSIKKLKTIMETYSYKEILIGGWDLYEFWWWLIFTNPKSKNSLVLESTIIESKTTGLGAFLKRLFLLRISKAFASGNLHVALLKELKFGDNIIVTRGVGLINRSNINNFERTEYQHRFLFLGRLSVEKNLHMLISVFNLLPNHFLTIVGQGPLRAELDSLANSNIKFFDHVDNNNIQILFSNQDFLILPSLREPWGLVIEESLYYRVPVIVSKNCGASELVYHGINGYIFDPTNSTDLLKIIQSITQQDFVKLIETIVVSDFDKREKQQVESYCIK